MDPKSANVVEGGKRPFHTIIPGFLTRGGKPVMSFGVMGGDMQPQGHLQTVVRMIDYHQQPQAACAPRWKVNRDFTLDIESHRHRPEGPGASLEVGAGSVHGLGAGQFIWRMSENDNELGYVAASDSRRDGQAVGFDAVSRTRGHRAGALHIQGREIHDETLFDLGAGLLALGACAASAQNLRIGLQEDPDVLDPHRARTYVGRIVFTSLCDKLIDIDPKLHFVPQLATSWTFSEDNKTLTFKLREDALFHDGSKFDAAAANLDRAMTLPDSLRRGELGSVGSRRRTPPRCADAPARHAAGPAVRPRRHDAVAQDLRRRRGRAASRSAPARTSSSSASRTTASWTSSTSITTPRTTPSSA